MALPRFVVPLSLATIGVDLDKYDIELSEVDNGWWLAVICTMDDERRVDKALFFYCPVPTIGKDGD